MSNAKSGRPSSGSSASVAAEHRLLKAQPRVQRVQHAQLIHRRQRRDRVRFGQRQSQLSADPCAGDRLQRARRDRRCSQRGGVVLDLEPEPGAVTRHPQQACRVVAEALLVQHAQRARGEVLERALDRDQPAPPLTTERQRDRVDGEVTPREVLLDAARAHVGQGTGRRVGLCAQLGDVDAPVVPDDRCGAETFVQDRLDGVAVGTLAGRDGRAQGTREISRVASDGHVELARPMPEQEVADGAADEGDVLAAPRLG